jgi:carbamoyl-phosphate synthase large subunit
MCYTDICLMQYWAAMQSTMNFRVPEPGEGILLGGDVDKNWLTVVVDNLSPLGYKFFCASAEVKDFIERLAKGSVAVQLIDLPLDKMGIRSVFSDNNIRAVFNLCSARAKVCSSPNCALLLSFLPDFDAQARTLTWGPTGRL